MPTTETQAPGQDQTTAQRIQGRYGWPRAEYEHGKRYSITRWNCCGKMIEKHQMLLRGKPQGKPEWIIDPALIDELLSPPVVAPSHLAPMIP